MTAPHAPPGCLILAAGSHRRFGSAKLLHPLADGRPLIEHTLSAILATGLPAALVHRPDDTALLETLRHHPLQRIPSTEHTGGLGHSLAAGVAATAHWNGWLICLADMPAITTDTYRAVAEALARHPIVIPHFNGHPGHPRGFQHRFFTALCQLHGDTGARALISRQGAEIGVLHRSDASILLDIDYPDDLHNLERFATGNLHSKAPLKGSPHLMTDTATKPGQDSTVTCDSATTGPAESPDATPAPPPAVEPVIETEPAPAEPVVATGPDALESAAPEEAATEPTAQETSALQPAATEPASPAPEETAPATDTTPADTAPAATAIAEPTDTETSEPPATPLPPVPQVRFRELPLDPRLQQAIDDLGFEFCTPIQALSLPLSLPGKDVIGKAQTGTGKTAAFLVTLINSLLKTPEQEERYNGEPRALILAPTRELAIQIEKDARTLIKHTPLTLMSIVGGMDYQKQQRRLQNEILDIIVGTPGRLIDFLRNKDLWLSETEILVIDEADRMLDMGFIPDVKRLVRETPFKEYRQTLMFSATFTQDIINLSSNWTRSAEKVEVANENAAADTVDQQVYIVTTEEKFTLLYNLINQKNLERVMIFANRRDETRDLTHKLRDYGIKCAMLSGEVPQEKRIKVLEGFREGRIRVLVATDVAGRGIHIDDVTHVVNYTLPEDPEDYVHRIGRTGRAGKTGTSISFACEEDAFQLPAIEKLLGAKLDCSQPEVQLLAEIPPPVVTPDQQRERESHNHRRRRPRRPSGNR